MSLLPQNASMADAALDRLRLEARDARAAADSAGGWWTSLIGADSTAAALRANAIATERLYETMRAKRAGLTDATVGDFLRTIGQATGGSWREVASLITPAGAVVDVASGVGKDVTNAAVAIGNASLGALKLAPWALLVVGAVVLYSHTRR